MTLLFHSTNNGNTVKYGHRLPRHAGKRGNLSSISSRPAVTKLWRAPVRQFRKKGYVDKPHALHSECAIISVCLVYLTIISKRDCNTPTVQLYLNKVYFLPTASKRILQGVVYYCTLTSLHQIYPVCNYQMFLMSIVFLIPFYEYLSL